MTCYSHSRISCFEQCKYKFKLQYIDKIKVDVPTTVEAFMGDLVHRTLEKLYNDLKFAKMNSLKDLISFYKDLWSKEWIKTILIVKDLKAENYLEMGVKYITDYYEHYKPFDDITVMGLETQDRMLLPDGNSYHIRIDKFGFKDGVYFICDYKTNSRMKDQSEADSDRQLAMYSIWVKNKFKDASKVVLRWYMLAFDKEVESFRSEEELSKLQEEIVAKIKEIESTTEYPTNITALCNYCVFKSLCPLFKHEVELEEKEINEFLNDSGVKLVNEYVKIKNTLKIVNDEAEEKLGKLKEALIEFCSKNGVEVVVGSDNKISVKEYSSLKFPGKNTPEREKLIELLKKINKLDGVLDLDIYALAKVVKNNEWDDKDLKELEQFEEKVESYRLSVGKK